MLSELLKSQIEKIIKRTFDRFRLNLLGPEYIKGKSLVFSYKNFDPKTTLVSNYLAAHSENSIRPGAIDKDIVKKVEDVASSYLDSMEQKSLADISRIVSDRMENLHRKAKMAEKTPQEFTQEKEGKEILSDIQNNLQEQKEKINKAAGVLTNHELHSSMNYGALDGIVGISKSMGIDDPNVFKIGVLDENRCKYCWRLWTMSDEITPKVYKLSELDGAPGHWKNPQPSIQPTHVNCRDILTVLLPGFGFEGGKIAYKGDGWDEHSHQRK